MSAAPVVTLIEVLWDTEPADPVKLLLDPPPKETELISVCCFKLLSFVTQP